MQSTAQGYLIYQITHSPAYLGLVGFAGGAPSLLFTLFGGVVADRLPRRRLLVITQTTMMILAFILAALTFTDAVRPWHIIILAFLLGVANAFDAPARTSFVLELVDRETMTNAIALNSTMFNIATVVGPSVAGLTYAAIGPAWCFTLNGLSFIAVIIALLFMRIKLEAQPAPGLPRWRNWAVGIRYVLQNRLDSQPDRISGNCQRFWNWDDEPFAGLGHRCSAWRRNHERLADFGAWLWIINQRSHAGLLGCSQIARQVMDLRCVYHAGYVVYFCLDSLAATFPGHFTRRWLGIYDGFEQQPGNRSVSCSRCFTRSGNGRLHPGILRFDADWFVTGR